VRPFPRTRCRRLAGAAVAVSLAIGLAAVPLRTPPAEANPLKDRQSQVRKKIDEAHHDLDDSSARTRRATIRLREARSDLSDARAELSVARTRLGAAQARDAAMQEKLEKAQARLEAARAEVRSGRRDVAKQQEAVEDVVVGVYQEGDPDLLGLEALLNAETPEDITRRDIVRDAVADDQAMAYDELRATLVLLRVRRQEVAEARREVARVRREAARHLEQMEVLEDQATQARDAVVVLVGRTRDVRAEAVAAERDDRAALQQLKQQEQTIREKLRRQALAALRRKRAREAAARKRAAAEAARSRAESSRSSSGGRSGGGGTPSRAAAGRSGPPPGVLRYPVNGYVTSPYGYRKHPIYGYWGLHDGTDFGAGGCGAPLYATAGGRVMSSVWNSVYGNRLIINHGLRRGKGLASVYNHASRYVVGVGQRVSRGQLIGYMGSTGWSTGCHLHFTVLANGRTVDPMNWF
jgi:murein DD-endopeptidase MepM/ murein hydrolase activator NlpD